ncbi:MAG: flagellar basal body-associated FliL family protein [Desulfotignum sp.]|nr:flagellar basal body-associated FliL family protein [Desulfotignum sp.]MCF8136096.1 flagellar basal body-associated FliL family protein [Desulfotignum sp.]
MPEADASEKKSSKRPVVVIGIAVILVLLVGGGFAGWTWLKSNSSDEIASPDDPPGPAVNPEAAPLTYTLNTYIVNLMGNSGMSNRYLKVGVLLGISDPATIPVVEKYKPLLDDAALILLSSKTYNDLATVEGKIVLKQEFISRMNQILGSNVVNKIYFSEFVVQ